MNSFFRILVPFISHLSVCGYLIWLAVTHHADGSAAEKVDQVIFVDFLGFFILSFTIPRDSKGITWEWPISFGLIARLIGHILLIILFAWFIEDASGWPIAIAWGFGIFCNLSNIQSLRTEAIARVIWAIVSAFLAAMVGSIMGVEEDDLLTNHLPTLLGWGLTYFGGVAIGSLLFGLGAFAVVDNNGDNPADN